MIEPKVSVDEIVGEDEDEEQDVKCPTQRDRTHGLFRDVRNALSKRKKLYFSAKHRVALRESSKTKLEILETPDASKWRAAKVEDNST